MKINFIKLLYEEENNMKKNKGITLVALVVTIVVLLILAGVSINLVLGNNGIIAKAKDAETKSAEASQNDLKGMNGLVSEMEGALAGNGSTGSGSGNGNTGSGNNFVTKNTEVTYPDGKVWIPEGFKVAGDSASTVQGGVVIEDKDGNQFVWVPVATIADYKRTAYSTNVATEETDTATNSIKININSSISDYFTEALPEYAWDTTIAFIEKTVNNYGSSSSQGNYSDTSVTYKDITDESKPEKTKAENSSLLVATGQTTPVCNIYDMGGNVFEWTTESYSITNFPYARRGGSYLSSFADSPAGRRLDGFDDANANFGFRLTLFM